MITHMDPLGDAVIPSKEDVETARLSTDVLVRRLESGHDLRVRFPDNGKPGEELILPEMVGRLLLYILGQVARGNAIRIYPLDAELTTKQAATFLNVSRPYVIKQIDAGELPCKMVGTHRRIMLHDLIEYKNRVDRKRDRALQELSEMTQEFGEDD